MGVLKLPGLDTYNIDETGMKKLDATKFYTIELKRPPRGLEF